MNTYRGMMENNYGWPEWFVSQGLYIISARNILVQQVKKLHEIDPVPGILWIDSDMQWNFPDVELILSHAEYEPGAVIGCLYPGREGEHVAGAITGSGQIAEASHLGFGFTWTPISCFDGPSPWFFNEWEGDTIVGEDVYFCRQQKKTGRRILGIKESTVKHAYEPGPRGMLSPGSQIIDNSGVRYI